MQRQKRNQNAKKGTVVPGIYQAIDITSAVLILSGQITATGVFISPQGFWLSMTGPILGGVRATGDEFPGGAMLDLVDVVTALLLLLGQVTVTGPWVTSGSFNLVITGPAFGVSTVPVPMAPNEAVQQLYKDLRQEVVTRFVTASGENH